MGDFEGTGASVPARLCAVGEAAPGEASVLPGASMPGQWMGGDAVAAMLAAVDEELVGAGFATLTRSEREALAGSRAEALGQTERVEFGEGPTALLTRGLTASPYVRREELPTCVAVLEEAFYRIKDETLEVCPDEVVTDELLSAFDEYTGDAELAACMAADRLRVQWTPCENPWSEDRYEKERSQWPRGSSIPRWELAERALSVEYVLSGLDDCPWVQDAVRTGRLAGGAEGGLNDRSHVSDGAGFCGDALACSDSKLAYGLRDDVEYEHDAGSLPGFDLDSDVLVRAFDAGVARIRAKAAEACALCGRVRQKMPRPTSRSMRDTLASIASSFDLYDPVLSAHVVPCDIDYQLALPMPDAMLGIDYVHEYLRRLALENDLLSRRDPDERTRLLDVWMPDWRDLVANLYEPVALAALRATGVGVRASRTALSRAADEVARHLDLGEEARLYLREFARQSRVGC